MGPSLRGRQRVGTREESGARVPPAEPRAGGMEEPRRGSAGRPALSPGAGLSEDPVQRDERAVGTAGSGGGTCSEHPAHRVETEPAIPPPPVRPACAARSSPRCLRWVSQLRAGRSLTWEADPHCHPKGLRLPPRSSPWGGWRRHATWALSQSTKPRRPADCPSLTVIILVTPFFLIVVLLSLSNAG